ncbi:uncharacterized protein RSE6_04380 [Rhynchosporium secalis]|uniref:Uncharacterized protein n=1 Tax=Rhynchosporium secalis TaxID=38038 RepID=A0A1E1M566_RHYSE|nr:uncharacterized protein RSE6_04380 [Rhynchosporium secalis]
MTLEIKVERAALFDYRKAKAQAKLRDRGDAEEDGLVWFWVWANEAELQHYCNSLN